MKYSRHSNRAYWIDACTTGMKSILHWHTCHFDETLSQFALSTIDIFLLTKTVNLQNAEPCGTQSRLCLKFTSGNVLDFFLLQEFSPMLWMWLHCHIPWWTYKSIDGTQKGKAYCSKIWSLITATVSQHAPVHSSVSQVFFSSLLFGLAIDNWGWFESLALWTTWLMRLSTHLIISRTKNTLQLRLNKQNSSFGVMLALPSLRWHSNHVILW